MLQFLITTTLTGTTPQTPDTKCILYAPIWPDLSGSFIQAVSRSRESYSGPGLSVHAGQDVDKEIQEEEGSRRYSSPPRLPLVPLSSP